jgi:hypothetical protein
MNLYSMTKPLVFVLTALFFISFAVLKGPEGDPLFCCSTALAKNKAAGPPPHAKAHGYRAKYAYRYYPSAQVYYDVDRRAYFHLEGKSWQISVSLPTALRVQLGDYVTLEMNSDKPYLKFEEHQKRYPPGHLKKR